MTREENWTRAKCSFWETFCPTGFGMTEVTVPNLYTGNKRKLGDLITLANANQQQFLTGATQVCCWLPGMLMTALSSQGWSLFGHIPLLRGGNSSGQML